MTEQIFVEPTALIFIQSRATTHADLVDEYAEMMQNGVQFDPAQGVRDENGQVYVYDGLHRGEAARQVGTLLLVEVRPGTKLDAEWLSLAANQKHGLRRTREDLHRVVRLALLHPNGAQLSNSEVARHCGVSDKTVAKIRRELEASSEIPKIETRLVARNGQTYAQDTRHIGSQPYVSIWELERSVRRWLVDTFDRQGEQIQALEAIKRKILGGPEYLEQLLTGDILPHPRRKADVVQACHNVLAQMWQDEKKAFEDLSCPECSGRVFYARVLAGLACDGCWRCWDDTAAFRAEAQGNPAPELPATTSRRASSDDEATPASAIMLNRPNGATLSIPRPQFLNGHEGPHQPKAQEFECPRCGQEKIVGVNGSRRWCLNCGAEWSTAAAFLAEVQIKHPLELATNRESTKMRLRKLVSLVDACPDEQLDKIVTWLDNLETALAPAPEHAR